jgi:scavenger receptor class B, member 1
VNKNIENNVGYIVILRVSNKFIEIILISYFKSYQKNGSSDILGDFNMDTGNKDIKKLGILRKWNFKSDLQFQSKCSKLGETSAGDFFPPGMSKEKFVNFFSPEICRNALLEFEEEREINGLKAYKYTVGDRLIDNGTLYPENKCYCSGDCVPSGLFNVSACKLGAPLFMSLPHFYKADPFYLSQVDGMNPNKEKHDVSISFEPVR